MRGADGPLMLLCGTANPELGKRISEEVGVPLAPMEITRFADGEFDVRIGESVRGHDVFVIQPTCPPVNDNYMELFVILDALRRASAARINAVLPYYGYQRKEKKTRARDPISAKLMANFLQVAGAERMIVLDLHAEAIQGFFDIPVDALTASKILASRRSHPQPPRAPADSCGLPRRGGHRPCPGDRPASGVAAGHHRQASSPRRRHRGAQRHR